LKSNAVPTVSIGMPAYNSAGTLRASIDCLLAQSFRDFELIISDNASSDDTWAIVQHYASLDARVVALRQEHNIGANGNYSAVFRAARGRYFKWASSNDWCSPHFLERCVDHLEVNADVALVAPSTRLFTETPSDASDYESDMSFDAADAVERFVSVSQQLALNNVLNGVVRTEVLRSTNLIEHYPGADVVLVGHIALLGKIVVLGEHLFYRRMDRATATHLMSKDAVHRHHYPKRTARALFPNWRFIAGLVRAVGSSALPASDKWRARQWALRLAYWRLTDLSRDVAEAAMYPFRG
jgi:glycosyltransferase involved in cell wall biosynthesis